MGFLKRNLTKKGEEKMNCMECYWSSPNTACGGDRVCCNTHSKNYNKIFSAEDAKKKGCGYGTHPEDVYRQEISPWFFDFGHLS